MTINRFIASGNLGKDCETRSTPNGKLTASFSLAVKQGFGEHEKTSWVVCRLFGAKAETLPQYLKKGIKVTVEGKFVMEEWTDNSGIKRQTPTIIVDEIDLPPRQSDSQKQAPQSAHQPQSGWGQPAPQQSSNEMDFDDSIPF